MQRCMDDNGAVLNYCMNGFCGNRVLKMDFEQVPPVDSSGAENHGSCTATKCPTQIPVGKIGKSVHLSGSQWVDITAPATLGKYLSPQFTVLVWIKPSSTIGSQKGIILANSDGVDPRLLPLPGFALALNGDDSSNKLIGGPRSVTFTIADQKLVSSLTYTGATVVFNQWNHIAVVFDKGVARIYHNGVDVTIVAGGALKDRVDLIDSSKPWRIGSFLVAKNSFIGELDEMQIVPRLMTAAEINAQMNVLASCNSANDCNLGEACIAGTCVADCIDSDGSGEEALFIKGNTQVGVTTRTDYCSELFLYFDVLDKTRQLLDGNLLVEQICNNGVPEKLIVGCACDDGKCVDETNGVSPVTSCIDTDGGVNTNERGTARDNDNIAGTNDAVWHTDYCLWDEIGGAFPAVTSPDSPTYNKLREFKCVSGKVESEFTTCDCQNGVCV